MPLSGGPTSLPTSPSLWQLAQAPVNRTLPLAASPGFSTSGVSAAITSARCRACGVERVEQSRARLLRDLPVGMRAQPRDVGGSELRRRDAAGFQRARAAPAPIRAAS